MRPVGREDRQEARKRRRRARRAPWPGAVVESG